MDHALEIDEPRLTAYVLMRKANIALDAGKPDRAVGLTEAALRNAAQVPPRTRALILGQRGRALASLGEASDCAKAIDRAHHEVSQPDDVATELTLYCTPSYVAMEAAACWSQLGKHDSAITVYETSLRSWPDEYRRDHGLCLTRLAGAYAGREDVARACTTGRQAIEVVRSATSGRALRELQRLRVRLAPWRRDAEVSDLSERIRALIQPAA
jgi:tetratricopeptide (TPR) repeat protein